MPLTKVDASNIIDGVLPVANGGTGQTTFPSPGTAGNVLTSNGTAWTSVTPAPNNAISNSFPLKSGVTLTAGRAVPINSSGEVGDFPVVNSLSTAVSSGTSFFALSTNGSRAFRYTHNFNGSNAETYTFFGSAITEVSITNGGTTATSVMTTDSYGAYSPKISWFPIASDRFLVTLWSYNACAQQTYLRAFVLQVDSSGNCTKGTDFNAQYTSSNNASGYLYPTGFQGSLFGLFGFYNASGSGTPVQLGWSVSVSGTTITASQDNDFFNWRSSYQGTLTSNNIAVGLSGNTAYTASWSSPSLGTVSTATVNSSASSIVTRALSSTVACALWVNASNNLLFSTYSINQTTGALTLVGTRTLEGTNIGSVTNLSINVASATQIYVTATFGGIPYGYSIEVNSGGTILGGGIRIVTNVAASTGAAYSGASNKYVQYNGTSAQTITVNSYNTPQWSTIGATATTQNTSPATVVIAGICGGFSGLTPGAIYYVDETTYNGAVTTTAGSYLVGTAASTTQLLVG